MEKFRVRILLPDLDASYDVCTAEGRDYGMMDVEKDILFIHRWLWDKETKPSGEGEVRMMSNLLSMTGVISEFEPVWAGSELYDLLIDLR